MLFELRSSLHLRGALVWQLACALILGTLLVSRAVDSSPTKAEPVSLAGNTQLKTLAAQVATQLGPKNSVTQVSQSEAVSGGITTIITHAHNRILNTFNTELYTWLGNVDASLAHTLLDTTAAVTYRHSTYENQVPAEDGRNRQLVLSTTIPMIDFYHVGFPQVETFKKRGVPRYKLYRPTMHVRVREDGSRDVVANIRCHGYSPHRTHRLAAKYEHHINEFSEQYSVDKHLVKAIIAQESCFRNHAVSPVGAVGLMQLMPATARWLGADEFKIAKNNLHTGVRYLSQLIHQFGNRELVLAAYNAGPGNVRKYNGVPPFPETRNYIERVMTNYHSYAITELFNSSRR